MTRFERQEFKTKRIIAKVGMYIEVKEGTSSYVDFLVNRSRGNIPTPVRGIIVEKMAANSIYYKTTIQTISNFPFPTTITLHRSQFRPILPDEMHRDFPLPVVR